VVYTLTSISDREEGKVYELEVPSSISLNTANFYAKSKLS